MTVENGSLQNWKDIENLWSVDSIGEDVYSGKFSIQILPENDHLENLPCKRLWRAVLLESLWDIGVSSNTRPRRRITEEEWQESRDWLMADYVDTEDEVFKSIHWVCDILERDWRQLQEYLRHAKCTDCGGNLIEQMCGCGVTE